MSSPDLILHRGLFTTLDRGNPTASAVAIRDGVFTTVGHDQEVMKLAGPSTKVIDLRGRRVLPGLIDNHLHIIRGGLNFNMELRWDGVWSLADAMAMLKKQVAITPPPQWVRVVGGFTEHQFAEKRLPTIDELNAVAPETPVFLLHLYDRAILNAAALRATRATRSLRCSTAIALREASASSHSIATDPEPAPTSQRSSPRRGANADNVRARISRLVICPSCSYNSSAMPAALGRIRAPSSAATSIATVLSRSIDSRSKEFAGDERIRSRGPASDSSTVTREGPKPIRHNRRASVAGASWSEVRIRILGFEHEL